MDILKAARILGSGTGTPRTRTIAGRTLGPLGGTAKTEKKQKASRKNGLLGGGDGRPRQYPQCPKYRAHVFSPKTGRCYGCGFQKPAGMSNEILEGAREALARLAGPKS